MMIPENKDPDAGAKFILKAGAFLIALLFAAFILGSLIQFLGRAL